MEDFKILLSLLNFEDDSLPKVRRAIITTSSLLIFVSIFDVAIDFNKIGFVSTTINQADPKLILTPLNIYLFARLIVVKIWFIPLAKLETSEGNEKLKSLAAALMRLEAQKPDLLKVIRASEKLPWQKEDTADRAVAFTERLAELINVVDRASRDITIRMEQFNETHRSDRELYSIDGKFFETGELLSELRAITRDCFDKIRDGAGGEISEIRLFLNDSRSTWDRVNALASVINEEISQKNLYQVFRALNDLDGDRVKAGNIKNWDSVVFGL